jgi:hypothetical protein
MAGTTLSARQLKESSALQALEDFQSRRLLGLTIALVPTQSGANLTGDRRALGFRRAPQHLTDNSKFFFSDLFASQA